MAEMKKFLSTEGLSALVDQIKAEDAKILAAANKYTDDAGKLYDTAGAAATALKDAKDYTDLLANGQVATNKADIAKLNGDATTEGSVAKAIADAKATIDADIDDVEAKADAAQAAADAAQGEVDALETFVGNLPEGSAATSVIDYVNIKTAGIATDTALGELNNQVTALQGVVNGITADYLTSEDKTELSDAIAAEASRADAAEKANAAAIDAIEADYMKAADKTELQGNIDGVAGRVATIEGDYLKNADKTALQGAIDLKADQTALDAEVEAREGAISGLQTQINTIMNNPDAEGAINSINEFTTWVNEHGTVAEGMRTDINANAKAIEDEAAAARAAESALSGRLDTLEAIDHDAYVAADTALENKLNGEIAKKANASDVATSVETLEAADEAQVERIAALEAKFTGDSSVADQIADAKQEAIDAAAADATGKANQALADAKAYADEEDAKIEARVATLETASATHALASDLNALTGRVTTAEGKVSTLETEMDAVEGKASANETAIGTINTELAKKAAQTDLEAAVARIAQNETDITALEEASATHALTSDLEAAVERIAANETAIAANTSAINSFTAITADEVNALFA